MHAATNATPVQALPAEITHGNAARCLETLLSAAGADFDACALQAFDSSALAVLLECRRQALAHNRVFRLRNADTRLRELARVYGVDGLLFDDRTP